VDHLNSGILPGASRLLRHLWRVESPFPAAAGHLSWSVGADHLDTGDHFSDPIAGDFDPKTNKSLVEVTRILTLFVGRPVGRSQPARPLLQRTRCPAVCVLRGSRAYACRKARGASASDGYRAAKTPTRHTLLACGCASAARGPTKDPTARVVMSSATVALTYSLRLDETGRRNPGRDGTRRRPVLSRIPTPEPSPGHHVRSTPTLGAHNAPYQPRREASTAECGC
jgi:hypothetical protein